MAITFLPKLVAFDLDGTLAESKQRVTLETGELVGELLSIMPAAVLSGASFKQFEAQLLPALPDNAHLERFFLFPTNAARCFRYKDGSWHPVYDFAFTTAEKSRIMQALKEAMTETGFDTPPAQVWGERIEDRETQITFSGLGQLAPVEEKKKWDPTQTKRKPLYDALLRRLSDFSIKLNAATSIDITKKGVSKALGVRKLIELTGISISQMLYVGDALGEGGNDSVVVETGIRTHQVLNPQETALLIQEIVRTVKQPTGR